MEIWMKDDLSDYRQLFSGEVSFEKGRVFLLAYDENLDKFVLR